MGMIRIDDKTKSRPCRGSNLGQRSEDCRSNQLSHHGDVQKVIELYLIFGLYATFSPGVRSLDLGLPGMTVNKPLIKIRQFSAKNTYRIF